MSNSSDDDLRRRRIKYRAGHRGIREMDLLMDKFVATYLGGLTSKELAEFEFLLDARDHDLLSWISGEAPTPSDYDTPLLDRLKAIKLTPEDYG